MNRTVIVEQDNTNILGVSPIAAKKIVAGKIQLLNVTRRKDVENSLISTGSPKSVRSLNPTDFNNVVMNRLSQVGPAGDEFRSDITKLITVFYGKELTSDGFFNIAPSNRIGQTGEFDKIDEIIQTGSVTGKTETADGGVKDDKEGKGGQNVGEILSGSAAVLDSLGGIIGLFTGSQPQGEVVVVDNGAGADDRTKSKTPWGAIIIGLVVVGAIIGAIVYFRRSRSAQK
jgi:hypothetical protein